MTVSTTVTAAAPAPTWQQYLDSTEAAIATLRRDLAEGTPVRLPEVALPAGPPPADCRDRAMTVARLLAEAAERLQQAMDDVERKLAATPRRPMAMRSSGSELSSQFDLNG